MEHAPTPESSRPRRLLTLEEARDAKGVLRTGLASDPKYSDFNFEVGIFPTENDYEIAIRVEDQGLVDDARSAAKKYIPSILIEVRVIGSTEAG